MLQHRTPRSPRTGFRRYSPPMRAWPLLVLSLCGCGDTPLRSVWTDLSRRLPAGDPIPAEAAAEGGTDTGASGAIRVRVGGRAARATMVSEQGDRRLWRAGAGLVVATDGGRVVATSGLREVLVATRFDGPDPLSSPAELLDRPAETRRLVDLMRADRQPQGMRFGVSVRCRLRASPRTRRSWWWKNAAAPAPRAPTPTASGRTRRPAPCCAPSNGSAPACRR